MKRKGQIQIPIYVLFGALLAFLGIIIAITLLFTGEGNIAERIIEGLSNIFSFIWGGGR